MPKFAQARRSSTTPAFASSLAVVPAGQAGDAPPLRPGRPPRPAVPARRPAPQWGWWARPWFGVPVVYPVPVAVPVQGYAGLRSRLRVDCAEYARRYRDNPLRVARSLRAMLNRDAAAAGRYDLMVSGTQAARIAANMFSECAAALAPAGQVQLRDSVSGQPCLSGETQSQCDARGRVQRSFGSTSGSASGSTGISQQTQTAAINAISGALNTTGAAVVEAIRSGNQVEIARIQAETQRQLAALENQSRIAMAQGNAELARQQQEQAMAMQALLLQLQQRQGPSTTTIALAGGGLLAVGVIAYLLMQRR